MHHIEHSLHNSRYAGATTVVEEFIALKLSCVRPHMFNLNITTHHTCLYLKSSLFFIVRSRTLKLKCLCHKLIPFFFFKNPIFLETVSLQCLPNIFALMGNPSISYLPSYPSLAAIPFFRSIFNSPFIHVFILSHSFYSSFYFIIPANNLPLGIRTKVNGN